MPTLFTMYTTSYCGDCFRIKHYLLQQGFVNGKEYLEVNIENDDTAIELVRGLNDGEESIPTLVFNDGSTLTEPSILELQEKLKRLDRFEQ